MIRCAVTLCVLGLCAMPAVGQTGAPIEKRLLVVQMQPAAVAAPAPAPNAEATVEEVKEAPARNDATFAAFPGGVVDRDWSVAYVIAAGGTLDAVDLKTGKKLWASAGAALPLAIDGDRVYALAPTLAADSDHPALHVVGMSIKGQGKLVFKSAPIKVEDWVAGPLGGKMLQTAGRLEKGKLLLSWNASATQVQGGGGGGGGGWVGGGRRIRMAPVAPRVVVNLAAKGSGKVDLEKGAVEETDKEKQLVAIAATAGVKQGGREFRLVTSVEKGTANVSCTDLALKKLVWKYDLELMAPAAPNAEGTTVEGIAPMAVPPEILFED